MEGKVWIKMLDSRITQKDFKYEIIPILKNKTIDIC